MTPGYAVASAYWSLGGFGVGLGLGWVARGVADNREAWVGRHMRRNWHEWVRTVAGVVILVLAVATTAYTARVTSCQARLNAEFRAELAARSDAARAESEAQRELLTAPPGSGRAAIEKYLKALDELDQARERHALPTETTCR